MSTIVTVASDVQASDAASVRTGAVLTHEIADRRSAPPTHRGTTRPPEPLTAAEVRALIGAAPGSSAGIRIRAMIAILYGSGLRLQEMLDLYPRDLDLDAGTVRVRKGKGGKDRLVGIDPYACGIVARWMDRRTALDLNGRHPIFCVYERGKEGKPLEQVYVRHALAKLGKKAGIEKRVHPRHASFDGL